MKRLCVMSAILAVAGGMATAQADDEGWTDLFDGKSLLGWIVRGGQAQFDVEPDGTIVGRTVLNEANSFLCPPGEYGDFILEFEFKADPALNSGVQIRSHRFDLATIVEHAGDTVHVAPGRVHGYQVEIDNDPEKARFWTAGIYEEGCRKWMFPGFSGGNPEAFTRQGKKLTKIDDWNHIRVECRGDSIKTWLNGELRADLKDSRVASGFIGFQVHRHKEGGLEVRWRNIRLKKLD